MGETHQRLLLSTQRAASGRDSSAGEAEERDLELGELAVSNPASATAGRAQAASERGARRLGSSARLLPPSPFRCNKAHCVMYLLTEVQQ